MNGSQSINDNRDGCEDVGTQEDTTKLELISPVSLTSDLIRTRNLRGGRTDWVSGQICWF